MTEMDLFYWYIPYIAEMIINLREMTPEQRVQWKNDCLEYAGGLSPFVHEFIRKMLIVVDGYMSGIQGRSINPDSVNQHSK